MHSCRDMRKRLISVCPQMHLFRHAGLEKPAPYSYGGIQTSSRRKSRTISKTGSRFSLEHWIPAGVYPALDTGPE
jgi:hypothetical protein